MISTTVRRWSAWAPGLEDAAAWRRWCAGPVPLAHEGGPEASFLPPMLRRRCSPLARLVLTTAFDCCDADERSQLTTVFASRHGNLNESVDLLERVAKGQPLSPTRFSHTVHNAQAGLFSIAAGNRRASSSVSARGDTFGCAFLEAMTHLDRDPDRAVLLVMADVPLAPTFGGLVDEPAAVYALALLLANDGAGTPLSFAMSTSEETDRGDLPAAPGSGPWPDAVVFLRWLLSDEPRFSLDARRHRWIWERTGRERTH